MDELESVEAYENVKTASFKWKILENVVKPCVANLLEATDIEGREPVAFILAFEFRRLGKTEEETLDLLTCWSNKLTRHLGLSQVRKAVRSAYSYSKPRYFGCKGKLSQYCVAPDGDRSSCFYYKKHCQTQGLTPETRKTQGTLDFAIQQGWLEHLSPGEWKLYCGLYQLERYEQGHHGGIRHGRLLVNTFNDVSKVSGVSKGGVGKILGLLQEKGLIEYKKGQQHIWHRVASEIRRVIPIPEPSSKAIKFTE